MDETYVIYADVLFLINFILDFLCLYVAGAILSVKAKLFRLVISAFAGGIYSLFAVYLVSLPPYITLPVHIFAALLICLIANGFHSVKVYLSRSVVFIVTSAFMGGIISALLSLTGRYYTFNGGFYAEISPVFLIIVALLSVGAAYAYALVCQRKTSNMHLEAVIEKDGNVYSVSLLVDSGLFVLDPLTGKRVIIVSHTAFMGDIPPSHRVIPVKTASGNGILYGFKPDKLIIKRLGEKDRETDAIVAIDTVNSSFSGCDGLISPASM